MYVISLLLIEILTHLSFAAFPNVYGKIKQYPLGDNPGLPLILTPFIEQGKIKEALSASEVHFNGFKGIKSYSGYFTVNKPYDSNMFFWFFPSQTNFENSPVILWLQGGPGATSLIGLFAENGPFTVMSQHGLKLRKYSWTNTHSVIYIDNPAGTGYSFTNNGFSENETQVGLDLYNALQQFFLMFPQLVKNDFFVCGESYGGKYVPAIAYTIHTKNPTADVRINLKGITMGNGFSDPINQLNYADYLYQISLIDSNIQTTMQQIQDEGIKAIQNKDWVQAFKIFDDLLDGDLNNKSSVFKNTTGFTNYFNFLYTIDPSSELIYMGAYIQREDVRAAIHVGNATFHGENKDVEVHLISDIMQSVSSWIAELLNHYRVLIYNGQLDIIVAYPLTENYLKNLNFSAADEYKKAQRYQWYVDEDLAGYVKQAGNLTEVLVRNAGHMVPMDQPKWAFDLISRFTRDKPFH
ncbi:venom serine carboxypeptidase [Zophobas morio]|uniref:venom serine carboxypeptidase n=1 Tax=Zophobas morio TaxID=2755281 RepID=UPI00308320B9